MGEASKKVWERIQQDKQTGFVPKRKPFLPCPERIWDGNTPPEHGTFTPQEPYGERSSSDSGKG